MNGDIRKILETAIYAPSGENTQPWRFKVYGVNIKVYNVPERSQSLYGWGHRASYMAIGAAIENINIAAAEFGYHCKMSFFPDKNNPNFIASINLEKKEGIEKDGLYNYIFERSTNRKPYKSIPLTILEEKRLISSIKESDVKLYLTSNTDHKDILGNAGSANEVIMLSNKHLHQFFFSHINWSKEEDDLKKIGFFIDTLELPPPALASFKIIKHWPVAKILQGIGMHKMVGKQNGKTNASAGAFGVLVIKNNNPETFVRTGRSLQRMWLTATELGLSLQPLTGIIFFMYKVMANESEKFSKTHVRIIEKAYGDIKKVFGLSSDDIVAFMFRIGHGGKPTARSSRFSIDEVVEEIK